MRLQRLFRCVGDPSRTQLRDPVDELHRNRFGEGEMDRPLSQLIAPEFIFERRGSRYAGLLSAVAHGGTAS
jgi:hypothetical protein